MLTITVREQEGIILTHKESGESVVLITKRPPQGSRKNTRVVFSDPDHKFEIKRIEGAPERMPPTPKGALDKAGPA